MRVEILNYLREKENYISGEELAHKLHLTRQAFWKHIQELRNLGYEIIAVPHLGYKLTKIPDKLYPWQVKFKLNSKFIGKEIFYFEKTTSTMDEALGLGKDNAAEGAVVCAEYQTKARGRLGRKWLSAKSKGLYFSIILKPKIPPSKIPCITLLSAVAVVRAVKKLTGLSLSIKWPNDVLIEDRKLAGILTELNAEQDRINFIVVGVGVNVNNTKSELPPKAVSLNAVLGRKVNRLELLQRILEEFEVVYVDFKHKGSSPIIDEWRKLSYIWGSKVKALLPDKTIKGEALDLDSDGALMVRTDSGMVEKIVAGDIVRIK